MSLGDIESKVTAKEMQKQLQENFHKNIEELKAHPPAVTQKGDGRTITTRFPMWYFRDGIARWNIMETFADASVCRFDPPIFVGYVDLDGYHESGPGRNPPEYLNE